MRTSQPVNDPRRVPVQRGGLFSVLRASVTVVRWLLISLVFSIVMEWLGMVFWWPEEGLDHSRDMLTAELNHLDADFRHSILSSDSAQFADKAARKTHYYLFEVTGFVGLIRWITPLPAAGEQGIRRTLHRIYHPVAKFVLAAMQIVQVFSVRVAILILATPVFVLFSILALVDGLVQRDLRRWGGGRESSFVYHYAKQAALPLVVVAWVIYLALPISLHPAYVLMPFAAMFGLSVAVTASRFKKYL